MTSSPKIYQNKFQGARAFYYVFKRFLQILCISDEKYNLAPIAGKYIERLQKRKIFRGLFAKFATEIFL